jgi:hypothetical protein
MISFHDGLTLLDPHRVAVGYLSVTLSKLHVPNHMHHSHEIEINVPPVIPGQYIISFPLNVGS